MENNKLTNIIFKSNFNQLNETWKALCKLKIIWLDVEYLQKLLAVANIVTLKTFSLAKSISVSGEVYGTHFPFMASDVI